MSDVFQSRLSRDARIETAQQNTGGADNIGRVSHGTRGLKLTGLCVERDVLSRVSHGTRGLKHFGGIVIFRIDRSRLSRDARIETGMFATPQR